MPFTLVDEDCQGVISYLVCKKCSKCQNKRLTFSDINYRPHANVFRTRISFPSLQHNLNDFEF